MRRLLYLAGLFFCFCFFGRVEVFPGSVIASLQ